MGDLMLLGVLRIPVRMWNMKDPMFVHQQQARCVQAADRIESDAVRIAELEGWIEDCMQMLTGDDDVCAALSKMEAAAKPQLEALLAGGDELLSEAAQEGEQ